MSTKSKHNRSLLFLLFAASMYFFTSCGKTQFTVAKDPARDQQSDLSGAGSGDATAGKEDGNSASQNVVVNVACSEDAQMSCEQQCDGQVINGVCYANFDARICAKHGMPGHVCSKEECGHDHSVEICDVECLDGNCGSVCKDGCDKPDGSKDFIINFLAGQETEAKLDIILADHGVSREFKMVNKELIENKIEEIKIHYQAQEDQFTYACYCDEWATGKFVKLKKKPIVDSLEVIVNEKEYTNFTFNPVTNRINFAETLPANIVILVRYLVDTPLPKSFKLQYVNASTSLILDSLQATLDGAATEIESYNATSFYATIIDTPQVNGAEVKFTYQTKQADAPQLEYDLGAEAGSVNNLSVYDAETQEEIAFTYQDGKIIIAAEEFSLGRDFVAAYFKPTNQANGEIQLAGAPLPGKIVVKGIDKNGSDIVCPADKVTLNGKGLKLSCDMPDAVSINISYVYLSGTTSEFPMINISEPETAKWYVYVDGALVSNFTRVGSTIKFEEGIMCGKPVMIKAQLELSK